MGGGSLGLQVISGLPIQLDCQESIESVLGVLNARLNLDFVRSAYRNGTDIDVY